jgi:hypothetical protein
MIIRFKYLQTSDGALQMTAKLKSAGRSIDEGLRTTAMLKVTDRNITSDNILNYLIERYPERENIEIAEIILN